MLTDKEFSQYIDDTCVGNEPFAVVYGGYLRYKENKNSLNQENDKDFFTKEQVEEMSQSEINKNFDKIRESMRKW